jgi:hypothetical protein
MSERFAYSKKKLGNWRAFAAVGGASLAAATNADAGIVYSGVIDQTVSIPSGVSSTAQGTVNVGAAQIIIRVSAFKQAGFVYGVASLEGSGGIGFARHDGVLRRYGLGDAIHASSIEGVGTLFLAGKNGVGSVQHGLFGPGNQTGFVGFKLTNGDLGWAEVSVQNDNTFGGVSGLPSSLTLISFAYNDVAGDPINAGETGAAVPEPSTMVLSLLAAGITGLAALRRAKAKLANRTVDDLAARSVG